MSLFQTRSMHARLRSKSRLWIRRSRRFFCFFFDEAQKMKMTRAEPLLEIRQLTLEYVDHYELHSHINRQTLTTHKTHVFSGHSATTVSVPNKIRDKLHYDGTYFAHFWKVGCSTVAWLLEAPCDFLGAPTLRSKLIVYFLLIVIFSRYPKEYL